jgi:hypothetical protein
MSKKTTGRTKTQLPAPTEGAANIAKVATGVAVAFASLRYPPAALLGPVLPILIDRLVEKPMKLLMEQVRRGVQNPSSEQVLQFVPMAYRYLEAAKEGEYEHNLRILAAYLAGELKQDVPDAPSFSKMARRVEGLTKTDLKVMVLVESFASTVTSLSAEGAEPERPYVTASGLWAGGANAYHLPRSVILESVTDLGTRGLLITDPATRVGKSEEFYHASSSFKQLMDRARSVMAEETGGDASEDVANGQR